PATGVNSARSSSAASAARRVNILACDGSRIGAACMATFGKLECVALLAIPDVTVVAVGPTVLIAPGSRASAAPALTPERGLPATRAARNMLDAGRPHAAIQDGDVIVTASAASIVLPASFTNERAVGVLALLLALLAGIEDARLLQDRVHGEDGLAGDHLFLGSSIDHLQSHGSALTGIQDVRTPWSQPSPPERGLDLLPELKEFFSSFGAFSIIAKI